MKQRRQTNCSKAKYHVSSPTKNNDRMLYLISNSVKIYFFSVCNFVPVQRPFDAKNPFLAPVLVNRNLFKEGDRRCLHIELDITGSKLRYEAGDHVAVLPSNDPTIVARLGEILEIDLDTPFTMNNLDSKLAWSSTRPKSKLTMFIFHS
jgi:sulfite reductase alpha subunit-like flavoprotein